MYKHALIIVGAGSFGSRLARARCSIADVTAAREGLGDAPVHRFERDVLPLPDVVRGAIVAA